MNTKQAKIEPYSQISGLQAALNLERSQFKKIGFIPTMGALHEGHIALVQRAIANGEEPVVSIFVNPKQFNNPEDLKKYPRTIENDCALLAEIGVKYVFAPTIDVIYPDNFTPIYLDLGSLDKVMEAKFRPGHFDGVVTVVHRLFDIVQPNSAYFGRKDFQQVAVIKFLVKSFELSIDLVVCDTLREKSGLAMSSRNMRLSEQEKADALIIIKCLKKAKADAKTYNPSETAERFVLNFEAERKTLSSTIELEYVEIIDPISLENLSAWAPGATCCVAIVCGSVRLIDNYELVGYNL
jgi:pantoate--beta-alanine ligase